MLSVVVAKPDPKCLNHLCSNMALNRSLWTGLWAIRYKGPLLENK